MPFMDERCQRAARCIHSLCTEFANRLDHLRAEAGIVEHTTPVFDLHKDYKHYVRVFRELKDKCGQKGGVVLTWKALHAGSDTRMLLPHFLLVKDFVHTVPVLSDPAREVMGIVCDDHVVFNDRPANISRMKQLIQEAKEPMISDKISG